jgi:glycosyltransferase involved in cell wall biosynthesis
MEVHACTIIARNYLPAARVLANSFREHHPDGNFSVLVVDDPDHTITDEPFQVLHLEDLGIEHDEALRMAAIYDVMELCTALKPWLLANRWENGASVAIYLDPDIRIYAPLTDLPPLAQDKGIVLIPHVTYPMLRDGLRTNEREILSAGIYNLGFIAVSPSASDFLSFWKERLRRYCIDDRPNMCFVDQRWVDFVPGLFTVHILQDPGYNVAYWNVDQRQLSLVDGKYLVNDVPLRFFHFSGYRPDTPYLLSKHQGEEPRVLLSERPDLTQLCEQYRAELLANGYADFAAVEYGFNRLANGLEYDHRMRSIYRNALLSAEQNGEPLPPNPLGADGESNFLEWVRRPADSQPGSRLGKYVRSIYDARSDLQIAFPDPEGTNYLEFANWTQHEVRAGRLASFAALAPSKSTPGNAPSTPTIPSQPSQGIRIAGYLRTESGIGELGRLAVLAAQSVGVPTSTHVDSEALSRQRHEFDSSTADFNVNVVCVNADQLPHFARRVGTRFFREHYTIGVWAWELEEFPEAFRPSFNYVDEVWAISEFSRAAISTISTKPVYTFPLPIFKPMAAAQPTRLELGLPDGFVFLFCFDLLSIFDRKNPMGLIDAFTEAFRPGEGPTLVVKVINGDLAATRLERLKWAAAKRPDIVIIDYYLDRLTNEALIASCDCYVSLHRSEGYGLTLAEAMALGKPVIGTAYSGNVDFMTPETSYLVPYAYGSVPAGCDPYPRGARWAEPDLSVAAQLMRELYEHPEKGAEVGRRAQYHVLAHHGMATASNFVRDRFAAAQAELVHRGKTSDAHRSPNGERSARSLVDLAATLPSLEAPSRYPRTARTFRRLLWRALRSYDDHQREVSVGVATGVEQSLAEVTDLRDQLLTVEQRLRAVETRVAADRTSSEASEEP